MLEFFSFIPNINLIIDGVWQTLYMLFASVIISHIIGVPLGILLVVTDEKHILPFPAFNKILGIIINIGRSIPFIILLVAIIPFTRWLVGSSIDTTASIVPLTVGAIPLVARMVESSLKEISWGLIEAALSMGASPMQIIFKVLLPESLPSLILGATITAVTLVSFSAMAGAIGGGGLGDIAVRYGYHRHQTDVMWFSIVILTVLVQIMQVFGEFLSQKIRKS
ncbi:D-methionine transport system permease protein [Desulfonispora thiosulfatigenes DSM 11270]|uniref:D-methionine transport system permease protein n=1 Tax=Desulfonispora thiosulfatigenes DSM 11270 TaxID=656914 RepID=A0A1W1UQN4_DESTI|nr:methionine ABC transporter permease [Desulfonispora thiosulfatigenes]SMB83380.1 D-methionine transport system permease protein [Desulfonispora thiosulfatigenes DSM 11270]